MNLNEITQDLGVEALVGLGTILEVPLKVKEYSRIQLGVTGDTLGVVVSCTR
jgi:hypothetical protein